MKWENNDNKKKKRVEMLNNKIKGVGVFNDYCYSGSNIFFF